MSWTNHHQQIESLSSPTICSYRGIRLCPPPLPLVFLRSIIDAALCLAICYLTILTFAIGDKNLSNTRITSKIIWLCSRNLKDQFLESSHLGTGTNPGSGNKLILADVLVPSAIMALDKMSHKHQRSFQWKASICDQCNLSASRVKADNCLYYWYICLDSWLYFIPINHITFSQSLRWRLQIYLFFQTDKNITFVSIYDKGN